jgi:uncharacterized protein YggU (UPF0235/DUF167 family)
MGEQSFFTVTERGVLVRVKAKPHAREDAVAGVRGGELLVSVRAAPEKGRATEEVIRVVASAVGVPRTSVTLKSGGASPHKVLLLPPGTASSLKRLGGT